MGVWSSNWIYEKERWIKFSMTLKSNNTVPKKKYNIEDN